MSIEEISKNIGVNIPKKLIRGKRYLLTLGGKGVYGTSIHTFVRKYAKAYIFELCGIR